MDSDGFDSEEENEPPLSNYKIFTSDKWKSLPGTLGGSAQPGYYSDLIKSDKEILANLQAGQTGLCCMNRF